MIKKHLHHFSRGLVIGFEILGGLALFAFVAWLALILRLSQGPLDVDFLTRNIEKSFNKQQSDFKVSVGSTMLTWGGGGAAFHLRYEPRADCTDRRHARSRCQQNRRTAL
jgi:hypothetical protein